MKNHRGVTLIALVITIIVLGILATISVTMLTGDKGIINQAKETKEETRALSVQDARDLWLVELEAGKERSLEDLLAELQEQGFLSEDEVNTILTSEDNSIQIGSRKISFYYEEDEVTEIVEADPNLWTYELDPETNNTTAILTGYIGEGRPTEMVIPNSINGIPIKKIRSKTGNDTSSIWSNSLNNGYGGGICDYDGAYNAHQKSVKKLTISEGIEEIGTSTFMYSEALEEVIIPISLKVIGDRAFYGCSSLPLFDFKKVEDVGIYAFGWCSNLSKVSVLGYAGMMKIGENAFFHCTSLTKIWIANALLNSSVFYGIPNITVYYSSNLIYSWDKNWNETDSGCVINVVPSTVEDDNWSGVYD